MTERQSAAAVLELRQVACRLGEASNFELQIDDFVAYRGETIALVGPSGSGKSTLMNILALTLSPLSVGTFAMQTRDGSVIDIGALWEAGDDDRLTSIRAHHHGYVLQTGGLLPYLSVRQNISLSLSIVGRFDPAHVEATAERLEIAALLERMPATLSVGQRQRVAIARAVTQRPALLLADEPTASVHPSLADSILSLLADQARENDATLVMATHDPDRAARHGFDIVSLAGAGGARSRLSRDGQQETAP